MINKNIIVECPFYELKEKYNHVYKQLCFLYPREMIMDFEKDKRYLIRIDLRKNLCEIGYKDDHWYL